MVLASIRIVDVKPKTRLRAFDLRSTGRTWLCDRRALLITAERDGYIGGRPVQRACWKVAVTLRRDEPRGCDFFGPADVARIERCAVTWCAEAVAEL